MSIRFRLLFTLGMLTLLLIVMGLLGLGGLHQTLRCLSNPPRPQNRCQIRQKCWR